MTKSNTARIAAPAPIADMLSQALKTAQRNDLRGATEIYRNVLKIAPDSGEAKHNLGVILCQTGGFKEGCDLLFEVVSRDSTDAQARQNLDLIVRTRYNQLLPLNNHLELADASRRFLRLHPDNYEVRNTLSHMLFFGGIPGILSDFAPETDPSTLGRKLVIACMPKSGSSWLSNMLETLTGWPQLRLSPAFIQQEQELYVPHLIAHASQDTVTQQHFRATAWNTQVLQAFGIQPIVLVRNIYDVLISMTDFLAGGASYNTFIHRDFGGWARERQIDAVIDTIAPWYFQFYASWFIAEEEGRLPVKWLTYENMTSDKQGTMHDIAKTFQLGASESDIATMLAKVEGDKVKNRYNKGVAGRGLAELSDAQQARIRNLASYYPSIDFGRIGL